MDARFASNLNIETYIINFILQQNKSMGESNDRRAPASNLTASQKKSATFNA
jgi:hypothetical protein